jgi:hypothetical protein
MVEIYSNCPVQPYATSQQITSPPVINTNYTSQDFWSMKTRLINFCEERFGPSGNLLPNTFNDFVESDLAVMLIENFAFLADLLSFKMDQYFNELGIDTVTQLDNAFRLAKLVGYQPTPPIASVSMWSGTLPGISPFDVIITTPVPVSLVSGNTGFTIELFAADADNEPIFNSPIIIPAGNTVNTSVVGLQGTTVITPITGNGTVSQTITLTGPVIYDSVQVQVDGKTWQKVDYFTISQPLPEFLVEFDANWNAYVIFGNNQAGQIPTQGSQIQITSRVGGGTIGNIVTNYVTSQIMVAVPGLANMVPVTFTNYTAGQYGYDGDTIDTIRLNLPNWVQTQNRLVSGNDYQTFADQFSSDYHGQVGKSVAALRNQGCAGNIIDLYVLATSSVANDLELASNGLKSDLLNAINEVKMLTDFVCIKDGIVVSVEVVVTAEINPLYNKYQDDITTQINNQLSAFFALPNWQFGQSLRSIDVIKALANIQQIEEFTVSFLLPNSQTFLTEVDVNFYEIIRPSLTIPTTIIYTQGA